MESPVVVNCVKGEKREVTQTETGRPAPKPARCRTLPQAIVAEGASWQLGGSLPRLHSSPCFARRPSPAQHDATSTGAPLHENDGCQAIEQAKVLITYLSTGSCHQAQPRQVPVTFVVMSWRFSPDLSTAAWRGNMRLLR